MPKFAMAASCLAFISQELRTVTLFFSTKNLVETTLTTMVNARNRVKTVSLFLGYIVLFPTATELVVSVFDREKVELKLMNTEARTTW